MEDEILDAETSEEISKDQSTDKQPKDQPDKVDPPQPIKVGDKEYTPDQLMEIEKKATHYEALLPDYTRKSQRLSELEKQPVDNKPEPPP